MLPMIRTESLTKYFGRRCAVRDFGVEIDARQIVGFLGLNGAGKTTTLRMLSGLLAPSTGRVVIDNEDLAGPRGYQTRAKIGFLPDRPPIYEDMTVFSYLSFAARLRGHSGSATRIDEVLERTALKEFAKEPIAHLSHGYRQRVGIAQAIVHKPSLVILDEPTNGLDPRQIVDMRAFIRSLKDEHTVLLSSHNLNEVNECCDEILVIHEGQLEAQGSPTELARTFGNTQYLLLVVTGDKTKAQSTAQNVLEKNLITQILTQNIDADGTTKFEFELTTQPEDIAQAFFEAGLGIRRLQPFGTELEDLFTKLTRSTS